MIFDIHCHLLPGVDDGSPDLESSVKLVQEQIEDGITHMIFTPHFRLDWYHVPPEEIRACYDSFTRTLKKRGIDVHTYLGQELHNHPDMLNLVKAGKALTLAGTRYLLLEFDFGIHDAETVEIVRSYTDAGYHPIVVHYERFSYRSMAEVRAMKEAGALFQINGYSLMASESAGSRDFALEMLENGFVSFVSTDYHKGKYRKTKESYALVAETYGKETAENLFFKNAYTLFSEQR